MIATELGIEMLDKLLQLQNVLSLIEESEFDRAMLVNLSQFSNALGPIEVTESGIVILLKFLQLL